MIGAHLHKSPAIARFCGWSKAQSITSDCSFRLFKAAGKATGKVAAGKANAKAKPIEAPAVVDKVVSKISQHHRLLASMIGAHLHKSPAIARFCGWSKAQSITSDCSLGLLLAPSEATTL